MPASFRSICGRRISGHSLLCAGGLALFAGAEGMSFPFYFPLGILLLDDDPIFLDTTARALSYLLPGRKIHKMTSGVAAVQFLEKNALDFTSLPIEVKFDSADAHGETKFVASDLTNLDALQGHTGQIGIVITDYAMPEMNGIEFSRKIARHNNIHKILLTGQATTEEALNGFNNGLIDRYVAKYNANFLALLKEYVLELENQFFYKSNRQFKQLIGENALPYLADENVNQALAALCSSLNAAMIAPSFSPPGIFISTTSRERYLIAVLDIDFIASRVEIAEMENVAQEMINTIDDRTHIYLPGLDHIGPANLSSTGFYPMSHLSDGMYYLKIPV